ncbi:phosphatidate cytidylyltransferase [bacterium]|nr:phosphatidate cytidylyltransferase [bacterium]
MTPPPANDSTRSAPSVRAAPLRGFRWRMISSLVLWAVMLAVIFWLPPTFLYVFLNVVLARALWEFYTICEAKGLPSFKVWGVIAALALISGSWFFFGSTEFSRLSYDFDIFILVVFTLGVFLRQFPQKNNAHVIETMAVTLFGLLYVGWLGNFITRINLAYGPNGDGRFFVMLLVVVTKFTDIGAYLIGSSLGRHKMIPRISPKKTWEGTAGGMVLAVGGAWLCAAWAMPEPLAAHGLTALHVTVIGVLLGAAAVIGDLAESLIKREAGVKDSSHWLPGHGGALDLVDSLLFTAPLLYVYMRLVLG